MIYHIQHMIRVMLHNNVNISTNNEYIAHTFTIDELNFKPCGNDRREYWRTDKWLVSANIEAANINKSLERYRAKMSKVIPRIAFIGQAYINDRIGNVFIKRDDKDFGWFRSIVERDAVPLNFMDTEKEALNKLMLDTIIPDEFYYYWNDAVNTTSYTGKLFLMFGAIDSLAKRGQRRIKRIEILGEDLFNEMYADDNGLRNKLTHGEYLDGKGSKDYVEEIHKKVLEYFNSQIIKKDLLKLDIVGPQRHFNENYDGGWFSVRQKNEDSLDIQSLTDDSRRNEGIPRSYEIMDREKINEY